MDVAKKFIQFGDKRLELDQIQAYQIIKGNEVVKTARVVNIDPNSDEGRKLLADFESGATGRAVGAGIVHGATGVIGGTVVGTVAYLAIASMTGGAALLLGGAIAAGNTVWGVKKSLDKSQKRKKDLFKKYEEQEIDTSVLQIILKSAVVEEKIEGHTGYSTANYASGATNLTKTKSINNQTLQFQADKCGFDIYEKCKELDVIFGVTSD